MLHFQNYYNFYSGQILNSSGAINFLITIDKKILNSPERDGLMLDIISECENFVNSTGIELRYAGLPYSRYVMAESVKKELETDDVACVVEAKHLCVSMRGIKDVLSLTTTAEYSGKFLENNIKQEMLQLIGANNE